LGRLAADPELLVNQMAHLRKNRRHVSSPPECHPIRT
jgi:hypothetical protein